MSPLVKLIHVSLGFLFLGLAIVGAFLPVLPTTPFLLLTSFFFMRASPRLHQALMRSPVFGPLLTDWARHKGVRLHVKVQALSAIVIAVALTAIFAGLAPVMIVVLLGLGAIGVIVVLKLPTIRD